MSCIKQQKQWLIFSHRVFYALSQVTSAKIVIKCAENGKFYRQSSDLNFCCIKFEKSYEKVVF